VVQVEALGACFQVNRDMAAKVPDLLVRSPSFRLERISMVARPRHSSRGQPTGRYAGGQRFARRASEPTLITNKPVSSCEDTAADSVICHY
jgi:hypothetical protein